jgi:hypothetical protein
VEPIADGCRANRLQSPDLFGGPQVRVFPVPSNWKAIPSGEKPEKSIEQVWRQQLPAERKQGPTGYVSAKNLFGAGLSHEMSRFLHGWGGDARGLRAACEPARAILSSEYLISSPQSRQAL